MWQGFQGIGGQAGLPRAPAPRFVIPAPRLVIPAPHFVIPAKAGIQRGGEECGKASRASEANPPSQERRPPDSSFRPPTSSFRRRPESRGAVRGEATPHPTTNHGQQAGPPPSSFRRRPESRGAVRGEATPRPTTNHGQQAGPPPSSFRPPTPVIPAKAGIQRGGEEGGKASRASEAKPASQERRRPTSSCRPPNSSFRRRPESRGAVRGEAGPPRCIGGQAGLPRAPAPRFVIPAPHHRHSGEGRNPEGR